MSKLEIRANYDVLEKAGDHLNEMAATTQEIQASLNHSRQGLHGEWIGYGSNAFFSEMDAEILPAISNLEKAFLDAAQLIRIISSHFLECEEQEGDK
ncbi:MAG: WXG100 family type VII secretion target, partial [Chloroflexota bacterium]